MITNSELLEFKKNLLTSKQKLLTALDANSEAGEVVELDQTRQGRLSRMDALQGQAMSLATKQRRIIELKKIEAALQRIDDDEYGFCLNCGQEIPVLRLNINPTATECVACAEQSESR